MCEYRKGREKDRQTKMKGSVIQGKGVEETEVSGFPPGSWLIWLGGTEHMGV
jgi:hypothetical protein